MLPEVLEGSYRRYKEDTNVFMTWLSQTAKACGYKPVAKLQNTTASATPAAAAAANKNDAPKKSGRLKGKERKLAREAAAKQQNSG